MDKPRKPFVIIESAKCVRCAGLFCVGVCPQGVFEEGKNRAPEVSNEIQCTRCGICVNLCPAKAIIITRA